MTEDYESRDVAKRRLKSGMINGNQEMGEGNKKPSLLVYLFVFFLAAAVGFGIWYSLNHTVRESYSIEWEHMEDHSDGAADTFRGYAAFEEGIIKYTKDGASYLDKNGNSVWDRSYQMSSPIIDVNGGYACIADQGSTKFYIFGPDGVLGATETLLPISLVRISAGGVVYAVLNDTDAEYISAFNKDGSALDLSVKSILSGDGYPFDIDVSQDGTELITSYLSIADGELKCSVVFRNFSSIGQNEDSRRVVGGFGDEFEGHLAGRVNFSTDELSQAFYDGGIVFFSTRVRNTPEVLANAAISEKMLGIAAGEDISAVLTDNTLSAADSDVAQDSTAQRPDPDTGRVAPYRIKVYLNSRGSLGGESEVDIDYKSMLINDDTAVVYSTDKIMVFGKTGRPKGIYEFEEGQIEAVVATGKAGSLYVTCGNTIYRISV